MTAEGCEPGHSASSCVVAVFSVSESVAMLSHGHSTEGVACGDVVLRYVEVVLYYRREGVVRPFVDVGRTPPHQVFYLLVVQFVC